MAGMIRGLGGIGRLRGNERVDFGILLGIVISGLVILGIHVERAGFAGIAGRVDRERDECIRLIGSVELVPCQLVPRKLAGRRCLLHLLLFELAGLDTVARKLVGRRCLLHLLFFELAGLDTVARELLGRKNFLYFE